ncbi:hypothetical protein OG943_34490 [Amycolatopsis sp. NBC_00345]|uniref:hypothetical protein n=1 Tax=Amycolatopsis sp. NBC_00345 TaxID=2975955 RepID=UPI002E26B32F
MVALAGSASAFFSWRSASKTSKAAEAANEAVALTVRPAFAVGIGGAGPHEDDRTAVRLHNTCSFDAVDVHVWVRDSSATQLAMQDFPRIRGTQQNVFGGEKETIFIPRIEDIEEGKSYALIVTVRYSDDRGLTKWEQVIRYTMKNKPGLDILERKIDLGEPWKIERR